MNKKKNSVQYPTLVQILVATPWDIRHWYNTLPAPEKDNDDQINAMKLIIKRNRAIKQLEKQKEKTNV